MSLDDRQIRPTLIKSSTVLIVLLAIAAWCSNPDQASFQRWMSRQAQRKTDGGWERLAKRVLTPLALATLDIDRRDYGFFSLVIIHVDEVDIYVLGVLGEWQRVR